MMQSAEPWHCDNSGASLGPIRCFTTGRRSLLQREVCSVLVVVGDVLI